MKVTHRSKPKPFFLRPGIKWNRKNFRMLTSCPYFQNCGPSFSSHTSSFHFFFLLLSLQMNMWFSMLSYVIMFGFLAFLSHRLYRFQLQRKLDQQETQKLKEMDELKTRLYANITHEFRTPLTLILGHAEQSITHESALSKDDLLERMKSIRNNGQRMLQLVNQILDLRKLEDNGLQICWEKDDIIPLLRFIFESFQSWAQKKNIQLNFIQEMETLEMDFDRDKIFKILTNLLSNAIKFTPEHGRITLNVDKKHGHLLLKIKDTGLGISQDQLPHIFDRFHQAHITRHGAGTGIGLTLVRELTELLGGKIKVHSIVGTGTVFTVHLPIHHQASTKNISPDGPIQQYLPVPDSNLPHHWPVKTEVVPGDERPVILLVEDNGEVATYLNSLLKQKYQVDFAHNGREGVEKAFEIIPDLIVSDLMMSEMDGLEMLDTVKKDERTSHIPVIILTARAEIEDRLEGLKRGADAYLAKPFYEGELFVLIERSLGLRKMLERRYADLEVTNHQHLPIHHFTNGTTDPHFDLQIEDSFCKKVLRIILEHHGDSSFNVEELCQAMGMSYSQLQRKLSILTGKSPNQIIREVRLQKAIQLLRDPEMNIGDVAFQTGFNDPSYFTRIFTREYGMPPSEYREKN